MCTWTPDLYRQFGKAKRASSGKALPDTEVRIVDPETGTEVATGDRGVLEARIPSINPDWVRTTDLASVNVDGFITLHGRADGAINRGGFKILPETVRRVLMSHPAVRDACVVGVPDARLGEVPFAAFETAPGMPVPSEAELKDLVRDSLPRHHVPVAIAAVDELPRNPSLKVSLRESPPSTTATWRDAESGSGAPGFCRCGPFRVRRLRTAASSPPRIAVRHRPGRSPAHRTIRRG